MRGAVNIVVDLEAPAVLQKNPAHLAPTVLIGVRC